MKVTGQNLNIAAGQVQSNKADKAGAGKSLSRQLDANSEAKDAAATAQLNLSSKAQQMQKAKEIASDSSIDEAKVARLQAMIDSGKYSVDAKAVADRLVDEHLLLPDN